MDAVQLQFERGVGDRFARWLTATSGAQCSFLGRADRAPDLVYSFKENELLIEVTAAYYDDAHATFLWKYARGSTDAPTGWSGMNPDKSLAAAIAGRVADKSKKQYGRNTVLLIEIPPGVTSAETLTELLLDQPLPSKMPFMGIFVIGSFPITSGSAGGFRVIPIKHLISA